MIDRAIVHLRLLLLWKGDIPPAARCVDMSGAYTAVDRSRKWNIHRDLIITFLPGIATGEVRRGKIRCLPQKYFAHVAPSKKSQCADTYSSVLSEVKANQWHAVCAGPLVHLSYPHSQSRAITLSGLRSALPHHVASLISCKCVCVCSIGDFRHDLKIHWQFV